MARPKKTEEEIATENGNVKYERTLYWVYRDNYPVLKTSSYQEALDTSTREMNNYPKSLVEIKQVITIERLLLSRKAEDNIVS